MNTGNSEFAYFTSITRKSLQTAAMHGYPLPFTAVYVIIETDRKGSIRKAYGNDRDERTNLYPRASCGGATSIIGYNHAFNSEQEAKSFQSGEPMADTRNRYSGVLRSAEQHQRGQKIKLAHASRTIEVAVSSLSKVWTTGDNEHDTSYERNACINYRHASKSVSSLGYTRQIGLTRACSPKGARYMYIDIPHIRYIRNFILSCLFSLNVASEVK